MYNLRIKKYYPVLSIFLLFSYKIHTQACTYSPPGGRIGDHINIYIKLFYGADYFGFSDDQICIRNTQYEKFFPRLIHHKKSYESIKNPFTKQSVITNDEYQLKYPHETNVIYLIGYNFYTQNSGIHTFERAQEHFDAFYNEIEQNPELYTKIKNTLKPDKSLKIFSPPHTILSVALHIRTGGDHEDFMEKKWPRRFLPHTYYIESLKRVSELFNDQPLFVSLFTDDSRPEKIVELYKKTLQKSNIAFCYRQLDNTHDKNILEDLFSMAQFDILIRPWSQFSRIAQFLSESIKLTIYPNKRYSEENKTIIEPGYRSHYKNLDCSSLEKRIEIIK